MQNSILSEQAGCSRVFGDIGQLFSSIHIYVKLRSGADFAGHPFMSACKTSSIFSAAAVPDLEFLAIISSKFCGEGAVRDLRLGHVIH